MLATVALTGFGLPALAAPPAAAVDEYLTVTTTADAVDLVPGDGVCAIAGGGCSFRAAVQEANALPGLQHVQGRASEVHQLTIAGADEDAAATGDIDITDDIELIDASFAANGIDRVLDVRNSAAVSMRRANGVSRRMTNGSAGEGGLIRVVDGSLTVTEYLLESSTAMIGGGLVNLAGNVTITNSTITGNTATGGGAGGIGSYGGSLSLQNVVVSANTAPAGLGGGVAVAGGTLTISGGTRVQSNTAASYGGGIATIAPTTVTSTTIENNTANVGGGIVALRDLTMSASTVRTNHAIGTNSLGGGIAANGTSTSITGTTISSNDSASSAGGLFVGGGLVLTGSVLGANTAADLGGGMGTTGTGSVTDATISGNDAAIGGGIANLGTLTVTGSSLADNQATIFGGGIASADSLAVTASSFTGNTATVHGGGIAAISTLAVTATMLSTNAAGEGGAIFSQDPATITQTTIAANSSPGGALAGTSPSRLSASIVAQSTGPDCGPGAVVSDGFNVADDASCALTEPTDHSATDPLLGQLPPVGPTPAMRPLPGSIAIDNGPPSCAPTDQWGRPRPLDGDGDLVAVCDIGAIEVAPPATFVVTTTTDAVDADLTDGACGIAAGGCSLRAAVQEANRRTSDDTIVLAATTYGLTLSGDDDTSALGDLDVLDNLRIVGNNATVDQGATSRVLEVLSGARLELERLTVQGGYALTTDAVGSDTGARGGGIGNAGDLSLDRVTVTANTAASGGGISNLGTLNAIDSTISSNQGYSLGTFGPEAAGAGLRNAGTATLARSTVAGNDLSELATAGGSLFGGGIANTGSLTVTRSAIVGNSVTKIQNASTFGSGLFNEGTVTISNSTIANNDFDAAIVSGWSATASVALDWVTLVEGWPAGYTSGHDAYRAEDAGATFTVTRSIVSGSCTGTVTSGGSNVLGDASCSAGEPTDVVGVDPLLGPLQGTAPGGAVRPLLDGSPAIGRSPAPCLPTDQRGVERPPTGPCDSGAYEHGGAPLVDAVSPTSGVGGSIVTLTGSGFSLATQVRFASWGPTATFTVLSDTTIQATVPAGLNTLLCIFVTNPIATSPNTAGCRFRAYP